MVIYYDVNISVHIIYLPVFLILTVILGFGITIWTTVITLRFRDLRFVVPFFLRLGIFITPIAYPVNLIPQKYLAYYFLNPVAGMVEGVRLSIHGNFNYLNYILISFAVVIILLLSSLKVMSLIDRKIADYI